MFKKTGRKTRARKKPRAATSQKYTTNQIGRKYLCLGIFYRNTLLWSDIILFHSCGFLTDMVLFMPFSRVYLPQMLNFCGKKARSVTAVVNVLQAVVVVASQLNMLTSSIRRAAPGS